MCGIAGVIRYGDKLIQEELIASLLTGNEHRGNDATGMAFAFKDGSVKVFKEDLQPWKFVGSKGYEDFINENLNDKVWGVLLHTRLATCGNPRYNENNHPLYAGKAAIIHNGGIKNDDELFKGLGLERKATTDSDIIRAIVDKEGLTDAGIEALRKLKGSIASAIVHPEYPQRMIVMRSGPPLTMAEEDGLIVFSSEKDTIHKALRPYYKKFGMWFQPNKPNIGFSPMPDDTLWVFGPRGMETHFSFKSMQGIYNEPNRRTYKDFKYRQEGFDFNFAKDKEQKKVVVVEKKEDEPDFVFGYCEKCDKEWQVPRGERIESYKCNKKFGGCGKYLTKPNKDNRDYFTGR